MIKDKYGRSFEKLRVSLINDCNFSCVYCVGDEINSTGKNTIGLFTPEFSVGKGIEKLKTDDFVQLISAMHSILDLKSVRLTGGEPLLYGELIPLIKQIKALGIDDIRMTTNAYYLKGKVNDLMAAGLQAINISVDAIDPEIFARMSRNNRTERVFDAIDEAVKSGIELKLNAVILRNLNDSQIIPLLEYSAERNIPIRYLELMKMGPIYNQQKDLFYPESEILDTIRSKYDIQELPRKHSATSRYWETTSGVRFGIIANESTPFCHDCNRLRMDSRGYFYGCLSNANGIRLTDFINDEPKLITKLEELLAMKQAVKFQGSILSMRNIGG
jgi:cyclic pyranopterin phosphate synthase